MIGTTDLIYMPCIHNPGGNKDGASKTLIGVSGEEEGSPEFLIAVKTSSTALCFT